MIEDIVTNSAVCIWDTFSTKWKLSRDKLRDGYQPIFGVFIKKNIFQNVPYITRNRPFAQLVIYPFTWSSEASLQNDSATKTAKGKEQI